MNSKNYIINQTKSLRDALQLIEKNTLGAIFVTDDNGVVIGMASDGDIRRKLLEGKQLDDSIQDIYNKVFTFCDDKTPRETLIKKLDTDVAIIPILDEDGILVDVISRKHFPISPEEKVYAQSRAPVRISFGGGGSDITHYFDKETGAVINAAISLYTHATLKKRDDKKIIIHSADLAETLEARDLETALASKGSFDLILETIKLINPDFGFELWLYSDFPMKSGLGGSATVASAILGSFNQFRNDKWDLYEMVELAYQSERINLGIAGGWQDQYASIFGGFNFLEFKKDQNIVHPLRIQKETIYRLEENLLLFDTGIVHESGNIHKDQKKQMNNHNISDLVKLNVDLCYSIRNQLLRGDLKNLGASLDQAWQTKKQLSSKISTKKLDIIYQSAIKSGALGGKLLGAGGGGFFLFFVEPHERMNVVTTLQGLGLNLKEFHFESEGVIGWKVRDN